MMKNMNLLIDLPEDLFINNILFSKVLPAKSLLSLRHVCKYLRNLITSTAFINMHLHRQLINNQILVLIDSETSEEVFYSLKFNDGDTCHPEELKFDPPVESPQIWGSCNGLLFLISWNPNLGSSGRFCLLWNPLTKEYKYLPPPLIRLGQAPIVNANDLRLTDYTFYSKTSITSMTDYVHYMFGPTTSTSDGFGYDRFIDDYKIIRCERFVENFRNGTICHLISYTEFQVYTLGTDTWRKISSDNNPYKSYFGKQCNTSVYGRYTMQFVNGVFHMVMSKSNWLNLKKSSEVKIVTFDIEKEVLGEMQWPLIKLDYYSTSEIRVLRGCLCVLEFDKKEKCCNVWMMTDYGVNESWTKLFTIVQNEVEYLRKYNEVPYLRKSYNLLRFCDNGEFLIGTDKIIFFYDPVNNKSRRVEFGECEFDMKRQGSVEFGEWEFDMKRHGSEIYTESLVSLNSRVYRYEIHAETDP